MSITIKPLRWREPTDYPGEDQDDLLIANGLGGKYHISTKQGLRMGGAGHLLWWSVDEFAFDEFRTIPEAKSAAQADHEQRMLAEIEDDK